MHSTLALFLGAASDAPSLLERFFPILILLVVVIFVIARLPRVDLGEHKHSNAFRSRRVMNWLPLGLTYAFLYMGRYNLTVSKGKFGDLLGPDGLPMMGNADFGSIFGIGTVVYGLSFLLNGPLTDRLGGKFAILMGAGGAAVANLLMGLATYSLINHGWGYETIANHFVLVFTLLYAMNMYCQSFGAVAIVKVNASWFHIRERGVFGAIFGILISLGVYFAFDIGGMIRDSETLGLTWVFFMPAALLTVFWVIDYFQVRNTPGEAGVSDFDLDDASADDDGERKSVKQIFSMMLRNPVILTIAGVEFCSGFLRQAIMQWYPTFAKQTNESLGQFDGFVRENWGMLLCCAGILGGVFAGTISDHVFKSRRGPVAAVLYGVMLLGGIVLCFTYQTSAVGWVVIFMSMAVIGVHGMLSGTASMDFGGSKNVGVAVGIIDGFVYLGTGLMALTYAIILPKVEKDEVTGALIDQTGDPEKWLAWPVAMIPMAAIGLFLAIRLWNASAQRKTAS
jgi:OPA family glycerol-3-phosphate transporter-like MFS transporter